LLDAGSGIGEVARQLGARVGIQGEVFDVDHSTEGVSVA
jgi:ubiquinone/menaquinone biosynthesis C-methylase UbiE